MNKVPDIEVLRMRKPKHTATLLAVCALALAFLVGVLPGTRAQYATSDQDTHNFVLSENKDVRVALEEPSWTAFSGIGVSAGTTTAKDPIVKNEKAKGNGCYFRVNLRIVDEEGNTLDPSVDKARVQLILQTLWSDPSNLIDTTKAYTMSEIKSLAGVNQEYNEKAFKAPVWNEKMKAWCINYDGILDGGESVHLFDKMVIPADYTNEEITLMGNYYVNLWVQAIQSDGFASADEALAQLSEENVKNDIKTT